MRRVADAAAYVEVERGVGVVVWLGDARIAGASRVRGHRFTAPRRRSWGQGPGRVAGLPSCALHATGDGRRLSAPCHASESEPCERLVLDIDPAAPTDLEDVVDTSLICQNLKCDVYIEHGLKWTAAFGRSCTAMAASATWDFFFWCQ